MKKILAAVSLLLLIGFMVYSVKYRSTGNLAIYVTAIVYIIIAFSYLYFEKNDMGTKEIAIIATLSAFAAASRVPFEALPNIKPITFLIALSGLVFGSYEGFLVGSCAAFLSNIFFGQGPWTPWQMFAWGVVGAISGFIGKKKKFSSEAFAVICFFYGFLFDWIMNIWHVLGYVSPLNVNTIMLAYLSGIIFDILHAAGNFVFCLVFYDSFYKVLMRFKNRLKVSYKIQLIKNGDD